MSHDLTDSSLRSERIRKWEHHIFVGDVWGAVNKRGNHWRLETKMNDTIIKKKKNGCLYSNSGQHSKTVIF